MLERGDLKSRRIISVFFSIRFRNKELSFGMETVIRKIMVSVIRRTSGRQQSDSQCNLRNELMPLETDRKHCLRCEQKVKSLLGKNKTVSQIGNRKCCMLRVDSRHGSESVMVHEVTSKYLSVRLSLTLLHLNHVKGTALRTTDMGVTENRLFIDKKMWNRFENSLHNKYSALTTYELLITPM